MIKPQSLREAVSTYLLDKLCSGELSSGSRLNIAQLARELEVSATPMREALFGLSEKGLIEFVPNKGFRLKELSMEEARERYQIIAALDGLALRSSRPFSAAEIKRMHALLNALEKDANKNRVSFVRLSECENAFIENCSNQRLKSLCKEHRIYTFPYEQLVLKHITDLSEAFETHREIIQLIAIEDFEKAASTLESTWQSCIPFLETLLNPVSPHET